METKVPGESEKWKMQLFDLVALNPPEKKSAGLVSPALPKLKLKENLISPGHPR